MAAGVAINLRGPQKLKENLQQIAKEKGTSVNEVAIQVLTGFVEDHRSKRKPKEKVERKEIPSAAEARRIRAEEHENLLGCALQIAEENIEEMLIEGSFYTTITPEEVADTVKAEFVDKLKKLGYFLHPIKSTIYDQNNEVAHSSGDLIIALDESDISTIIEAEKLP